MADFNKRFAPGLVEKIIRRALKRENAVRVLEIGCGEGRVLMELRKIFPDIELYGINKSKWPAMQGQKSLLKTGVYYEIFKPSEITKMKLPKIYFYDAEKLRFKSNFFDLVISQAAIPYFKRKDHILEEVWRVLKSGGKAYLHMDTYRNDYPDFLQNDTSRFFIYKKGKLMKFNTLIANMRKKRFEIRAFSEFQKSVKRKSGLKTYVIMNKNTNRKLQLGLSYDDLSSFDLRTLITEKYGYDMFWGFRSVFKMK